MPDPLLATVADLGILVGETIATDDPKALLLLRSASGIIRSDEFCGQFISHVVDDRVLVGSVGGRTIYLPQFPIHSVSLLERRDRTGAWVEIESTSYTLDETTGRIALTGWHTWYASPWRVTYTHGFEEIPDGVAAAVLGLASRAWETPIGVENERIGQRSIKYLMLESGLLPEEEAGLAQYRRAAIA